MILSIHRNKLSFFVFVQCFLSCNSIKESYYSYNVETYTIDTAKHLLYFSSLLSYGDYLFEYKIIQKTENEIYGDAISLKTSVNYDSTGIYLLSAKNNRYYEFDRFGLNEKVIRQGPFQEKQNGMNLSPAIKTDSSDTFYGPPEKVTINNIPCYYTNVMSKSIHIKDTVEQKFLLIKKEYFNSFYKIRGLEFDNKAYCIVGFNVHLINKNAYVVEEINNLRPLTEKEKRICKNMIKASGL